MEQAREQGFAQGVSEGYAAGFESGVSDGCGISTTPSAEPSTQLLACIEDPVLIGDVYQFEFGTVVIPNIYSENQSDEDGFKRCFQECHSNGFNFFGINRGFECFCGNNFSNTDSKPFSECNSPCFIENGCGAGFRLSVHEILDNEVTTSEITTPDITTPEIPSETNPPDLTPLYNYTQGWHDTVHY